MLLKLAVDQGEETKAVTPLHKTCPSRLECLCRVWSYSGLNFNCTRRTSTCEVGNHDNHSFNQMQPAETNAQWLKLKQQLNNAFILNLFVQKLPRPDYPQCKT